MENQAIARADSVEEPERLVVAAHQDVLPVIDEVARVVVRERIGAPAQGRLALEYGDSKSLLGERGSGGQSGEAAADYDDVLCFDRHLAQFAPPPSRARLHTRATSASLRALDKLRRRSKTR